MGILSLFFGIGSILIRQLFNEVETFFVGLILSVILGIFGLISGFSGIKNKSQEGLSVLGFMVSIAGFLYGTFLVFFNFLLLDIQYLYNLILYNKSVSITH